MDNRVFDLRSIPDEDFLNLSPREMRQKYHLNSRLLSMEKYRRGLTRYRKRVLDIVTDEEMLKSTPMQISKRYGVSVDTAKCERIMRGMDKYRTLVVRREGNRVAAAHIPDKELVMKSAEALSEKYELTPYTISKERKRRGLKASKLSGILSMPRLLEKVPENELFSTPVEALAVKYGASVGTVWRERKLRRS